MEAIFLKVLNMSLTAIYPIAAAIVLRLLFRKIPKSIGCFLWVPAALRLIFPWSPTSIFSLIPSSQPLPETFLYAATPQLETGIPALNNSLNPIVAGSLTPVGLTSANPTQIYSFIAAWIWFIGIGIMIIYAVVSFLVLRHRVSVSLPLDGNRRLCGNINSPFIMGIIRPRIYLPESLTEGSLPAVLAHEDAHLRRRDHWWKFLGFCIVIVHWFNPLVWLSYILFCRDLELACDEHVVQSMDPEDRKAYSAALLRCSIPRHSVHITPLAFGEIGVKVRIKQVLHYHKPARWVSIIAWVVCLLMIVCFLTDSPKATPPSGVAFPFGTHYQVEEVVFTSAHLSSRFYTPETAPYYYLTDDMQLRILEDKAANNWLNAGTMTRGTLTAETFDDKFFPHYWSDGMSAAKLREENLKVWELIKDPLQFHDQYYVLLQQENGDLYLAWGFCSIAQDGTVNQYFFHNIFKLKPRK